jgi:hypothetical protein
MKVLHYTCVTDGASDAALIPPLNWLLIEQGATGWMKPTGLIRIAEVEGGTDRIAS